MKKFLILFLASISLHAASLKVTDPAPTFSTKDQDGQVVSLSARRGKGWTVLFFYPKADTPGCTKQACAFRDSIEKIRGLGAEVYGVSADTVEDQKKFHTKYSLKFPLLADSELKVIRAYGVLRDGIAIAKRWTFVIDPELKIRWIGQDVDPMLDAENVRMTIEKLKTQKS